MRKSPAEAEFITAAADIYSREGDSAGLRDFYLAQIGVLQRAPLTADQKTEQITALRRGLIPALTRLKDFGGAVDQYIEMLNRYPEDSSLSTEAARYAADHGMGEKLTKYYLKTIADSPKDSRWPIVLARIETSMENYLAALDAYGKAIAIRPDRTDLRIGRADLFERLGRSDDAAAEYSKLYALTYHDPQWMLKLAEVNAREGKATAATDALKSALIEGRPDNASNYFAVARKLDEWNMLDAARSFAEQGLAKAGENFLADAAHHPEVQTYISIMTRLRRQSEAFAVLAKNREAAATESAGEAIVKEVQSQGAGSVSDSQWRAHEQLVRRTAATAGMKLAAKTAGETAARYFTPEEKSGFEQYLKQQGATASREDLEGIWLAAAETAGLASLEASWRFRLLITDPNKKHLDFQGLADLQNRRLQFAELGKQLDEISAAAPRNEMGAPLYSAADAYHTNGDWQSELRVLTLLGRTETLSGDYEQDYFQLLQAHDPDRLAEIARSGPATRRDAASNFVVSNSPWEQIQRVIAARATNEQSVWPRAYTALAGLYFGGDQPRINESFLSALNPKSIGELISSAGPSAQRVDRNAAFTGQLWFYYGSRYGEFLGETHQNNFEDYLPAQIELAPGNANAYVNSAEDYAEFGDYEGAIRDYEHALELDPKRALLHVGLARMYWKQKENARAIGEWKSAIADLTAQIGSGGLQESFWNDFATLAGDLRERSIAEQCKPELEIMLRAYIAKNSTYRDSALLLSVYSAMHRRPEVVKWFVDFASSDKSPEGYLADLASSFWIDATDRAPIYERLVSVVQAHADQLQGDERAAAMQGMEGYKQQWLDALIETKQFAQASEILGTSEPAEPQSELENAGNSGAAREFAAERVEVAAGLGQLPDLLAEFRARPESAPSLQELLQVGRILQCLKLRPASQQLLEFAYKRSLETYEFTAPNFLGLAEIKLRAGNVGEGVALLQRLALVVGEPTDNLVAAAKLLEKTGHPAEAIQFLERLVAAQPWNFDGRVELAKDRIAAKQDESRSRAELRTIASDSGIPYALRAEAATAMRGSGEPKPNLGSHELDVLASTANLSVTDANHAFFSVAREQAAQATGELDQKIQLLSALLRENSADDSPRVALFFALSASRQYSIAISDLEPLIRADLLPYVSPNSGVDDYEAEKSLLRSPGDDGSTTHSEVSEIDSDTDNNADDVDASTDRSSDSSNGEDGWRIGSTVVSKFVGDKHAQARIAVTLADSYEHLGDLPQATHYVQIALQTETDAQNRAAARKILSRLHARTARRDNDAARRPTIHSSLEQDRHRSTEAHSFEYWSSGWGAAGSEALAMKRGILLVAGILFASLFTFAWKPALSSSSEPLAQFMPRGAVLYLESHDFSEMLNEWNASSAKREWLASENYAAFSNSKLFLRLSEAQKEFASAAGISADASFLREAAGTQSAVALYDIGNLEFLYITRIQSSEAMKSALWQTRGKFEPRSAGGESFYVRTDRSSGRVVAFALVNDFLILATREDLLAGTLEAMHGSRDLKLADEKWYSTAVAAAPVESGDLRMVLNLAALVKSPHFRSYWIERNVSELRGYSAAVSDLYREPESYREERVLLRDADAAQLDSSATSTAEGEIAAAQLAEIAPKDAGMFRVTANPSPPKTVDAISRKLLASRPAEQSASTNAPVSALTNGVSGPESDLETRIDQAVATRVHTSDPSAKLLAAVDGTGVNAMMEIQSSQLNSATDFVCMHSAIVLSATKEWNTEKIEDALQGAVEENTTQQLGLQWRREPKSPEQEFTLDGQLPLAFSIHGRYLLISNSLEYLKTISIPEASSAEARPALFSARVNYRRERANFATLSAVLDGANIDRSSTAATTSESAYEVSEKHQSGFLAGDVRSLVRALRGISSETVVRRESGNMVFETVTYGFER